eukprot:13029176-Ditylum_brightwellii.AAC.1
MAEKGLNVSQMDDIASLKYDDFLKHYGIMQDLETVEAKSTLMLCHQFSNLSVEAMKFKINNTLWNPNMELPFNDITKAYYAAVKLSKTLFELKSNEQTTPSTGSEINKSTQETQGLTNNTTAPKTPDKSKKIL